MTALRAKGSPAGGVETGPATAERAKPLVSLDLTGTHPPRPPRAVTKHMVGTRVPPPHEYALRRIAERRGVLVSDVLRDLIEREVAMPHDVSEWLLAQMRQCDAESITETITIVVRHLAKRWPNGCRLAD